ncbi:MAG: PorT family protein [Candidatus Cloacimonetes bacterium]|nr:PorT family protein [Candidatus Cloacimonadota bacterium]
MKRNVVLIAMLLLYSVVFSQIPGYKYEKSKDFFGIKGGVIFSNRQFEYNSNAEFKTGFMGGFYNDRKISEELSIQQEFLFTMKGETYNDDSYSDKVYLDYIEIPFLVKLRFNNSDTGGFYLYFGPCIGLNVYASVSSAYGDREKDDRSIDIRSSVNFLEFSLAGGIMLDFGNSMTLDLRYSDGLTNTYDVGELFDKPQNYYFAILLGSRL